MVSALPASGGLYRSDDAGEHWRRINGDGRLWGRGDDFAEVKVDPVNPDVVYSANVVTWRSSDGGLTFTPIKGAPGGDDYHSIWINPRDPRIIMIAGDQGSTISVNGAATWSSWYNQPTAQFYHVSTDNQFPYRVYGGQQESGSIGISSRGNDGAITFREWHSVGVDEYGYVAPDPLNPRIIYGGRITRTDMVTGQVQDVSPEVVRSGKYRVLRTAPVLFSPVDPHTLYFAMNVLFRTTNGGDAWDIISPDLSRERPRVPPCVGVFTPADSERQPRRGVIYTVAPSPIDGKVIWAGTDDGLIHVTRDGGSTWTDVTPSGLTSWSKVSLIEASHFDPVTAYAAVNRIPVRRSSPLRLPYARRRPVVGVCRQRSSRERTCQRRPGGSGPPRAPFLRHREGSLLFDGRRSPVAAPPAQHARNVNTRSRRTRLRRSRGDARTKFLDTRRYYPSPPDHQRG